MAAANVGGRVHAVGTAPVLPARDLLPRPSASAVRSTVVHVVLRPLRRDRRRVLPVVSAAVASGGGSREGISAGAVVPVEAVRFAEVPALAEAHGSPFGLKELPELGEHHPTRRAVRKLDVDREDPGGVETGDHPVRECPVDIERFGLVGVVERLPPGLVVGRVHGG